MWILREYKLSDDELHGEFRLASFVPAEAAAMTGSKPSLYGSTPLAAPVAQEIAHRHGLGLRVNEEKFRYFLDYEADPREADLRQRPEYAA